MIGVKNPRASQADVIPHRRSRQMAAIARHELDQQIAALLGPVDGVSQHSAGIQVDVQVPIVLVADCHDRSRNGPAWRENV